MQIGWKQWATCIVGLTMSACSGGDGDSPLETKSIDDTSANPAATGADADVNSIVSLQRNEHIHSLQAQAGPEYAVEWRNGAGVARNPAQAFAVRYEQAGLSLSSGAAVDKAVAWHAGFAFEGVGRGESIERHAVVGTSASGRRVDYERTGGVHEWYENGPLGVEQGFTLPEAPAGERGSVELVVSVAGDLVPEPVDAGARVDLVSDDGEKTLQVTDLFVRDAIGNVLPSTFDVSDGRIVMRYDDRSAVYPVEVDPVFQLQSKIVAADGAAGDGFGTSVDIDGDTLVIGAPYDNDVGSHTGVVYVYTRSGGKWSQQTKLYSPEVADGDWFGTAVAISGDKIFVGAPNVPGVYLYQKSGTSWTFKTKAHGAPLSYYGVKMSLDLNNFIVGAPGSTLASTLATQAGQAYVYDVTNGGLSPTIFNSPSAASGDLFGVGVAISGDYALVGAHGKDVNGTDSGAAYFYTRVNGVWTGPSAFTSATAGDWLGHSVALDGTTALVGAPRDDSTVTDSGSVFVLTRGTTGWAARQRLVASDPTQGAQFGWGTALSGDTAVITTVGGTNVNSHAAYIFKNSSGTWTQQAKIVATDVTASNNFANAASLSLGTLALGADLDDQKATDAGAAYVYLLK